MYFFCDVIIFKSCKKVPKVVNHVSRVIKRSKSIFDGVLKGGEFLFLWPASQNIAILCHLPKIGSNRVQTWKMKGNGKVKNWGVALFLKLLSQNSDFFWLFWKFWPPVVTSSFQKWLILTPMLIGRW